MYNFFFKGDSAEPFLLPVPPDKLLTTVPGTNKIVDLISIGQYNILKEPGLRDFTLTILLPGKEYPFVSTRGDAFKLPIFYLNSFRTFKLDKKPVRMIITRTLPNGDDIFDGNLLVSFEDYEVSENAGEEGDFWVKLKLKEYVDIIITKQEIIGRAADGVLEATQTVHRPAKEPDAEYTVKPGDTLWSIAKKEYGDEGYQEIADANGIKNVSAPAIGPPKEGNLNVGGIIIIPPKEKTGGANTTNNSKIPTFKINDTTPKRINDLGIKTPLGSYRGSGGNNATSGGSGGNGGYGAF